MSSVPSGLEWECPLCTTPTFVRPEMLEAHITSHSLIRSESDYVCRCGVRSTRLSEMAAHVLTTGHPAGHVKREDNWSAFRTALRAFQFGLAKRTQLSAKPAQFSAANNRPLLPKPPTPPSESTLPQPNAEIAHHHYQTNETQPQRPATTQPSSSQLSLPTTPTAHSQPEVSEPTTHRSQPSIRLSIPAALISNLLSARNQESNAGRKRPGPNHPENSQGAKKTLRLPGVVSLWGPVLPAGLPTHIQPPTPTMQPLHPETPCYYPPIKTEVDTDIKKGIKEEPDATTTKQEPKMKPCPRTHTQ